MINLTRARINQQVAKEKSTHFVENGAIPEYIAEKVITDASFGKSFNILLAVKEYVPRRLVEIAAQSAHLTRRVQDLKHERIQLERLLNAVKE